jgi:predicted RNase H-like HicB family nuclease
MDMSERRRLTALIEREGDGFVSLCPEVDVASQGDTIEEARANLQEAVELFFETASRAEIEERLHGEVYVTTVEVAIA